MPRRCRARYTLDANGNLTSDGQHHFIYDAANRLNQVDIVQGEQASNVTYLHNALGQRVFKSERQDAQVDSSETPPGISLIDLFIRFFYWLFNIAPAEAILGQSYLYDDATLGDSPSLLGEYGNGGNFSQGNAEYIWLPTESGQAQLIGLYKDGRFYAIHTDHLGTPRLITDDSNQVVWQWAYSAFGDNPPTGILQATQNPDTSASPAVLLKATAPQLTMNLRMAGQYFDEESGLFENGFRSYRPGMGAYDQFDPIGLAGGLNRRGYVGGDPLNFVDPMGLTQADINNAFNAARNIMPPGSRFPSAVNTWSQQGKGGKHSFWDKDIFVDSKYLDCLDDGEAGALLSTILHELTHFNQTWYQFGIDNVRERATGGNASRAQDNADTLLWNNSALLAQYLKNRHVGQSTCQCRK